MIPPPVRHGACDQWHYFQLSDAIRDLVCLIVRIVPMQHGHVAEQHEADPGKSRSFALLRAVGVRDVPFGCSSNCSRNLGSVLTDIRAAAAA